MLEVSDFLILAKEHGPQLIFYFDLIPQVVGILLEVPNSIAAAGGLSISTSKSPSGGGDSMIGTSADISSTVVIAIRMVQTAVGLAVGLFAAALAVYPFGKGGYVFSF